MSHSTHLAGSAILCHACAKYHRDGYTDLWPLSPDTPSPTCDTCEGEAKWSVFASSNLAGIITGHKHALECNSGFSSFEG